MSATEPRAGAFGSRRTDASVVSSLLVLPALWLGPGDALAQGHGGSSAAVDASGSRVVAVRLEARALTPDLSGDAAEVRLVYRLAPDGNAREIPLRGVTFGGRVLLEPSALVEELGPVPVTLGSGRGPVVSGSVRVPGGPLPDTVHLVLEYRVDGAVEREGSGDFDLLLPLLGVDWPPAGAPSGMFGATVTLSSGLGVWEAFPAVPRTVEEDGGLRRHRLSLQVVPAIVRLRGSRGARPVFTFGRLVDLGVGGVLALLGGAGLLAFRRERP